MSINFSAGPLTGMRIVDLTSVIMGPFATHILGDLGADIVKVESPEGDSIRHYKPLRNPAMSGMFLNLNRNKRGVLLDLKKPAGQEALRRLIVGADVFIHSLRPDTITGLGFDYESVRKIVPNIVYCGAYGFGAAGPYRAKATYDDVIQAGSGIAALFGQVRDEPGYAPTVICDKIAGQTIAYAVMSALIQRLRGGPGMNIEVPMLETAIEFTMIEHITAGAFDPPLGKMGFPRVLSRNRKPYKTADGYMCILPYSDRNWIDFFTFVGRPELAKEERFKSLPVRVQHIGELYGIIEKEAVTHTNAEWIDFLDRSNIPGMPVLALEELENDPHVTAVELFEHHQHPTEGAYRLVRRPVTMGDTDFQLRHHAPRLGEHSRQLLLEAGYTPEEFAKLVADRVTVDVPVPGVAEFPAKPV